MKAGLIINASAGNFSKIKEKITKLKEIFDEITTGPGIFGKDFLEEAKVVDIKSSNFKDAIRELTVKLSECSDVIVSVGGDGTANFIASTIIDEKINIPIMGIAGGTANVGSLVRFSLDNIKPPSYIETIDCLKVWKGENHVGYAFIDAVFGDTFLGTLNNKLVNLSAKKFLKNGVKMEKKPRTWIGSEIKIMKNKRRIPINMKNIAQIVASPLNHSDFYIGKAITGSLSWAHFLEVDGCVALSNKIIVDSYLDKKVLYETVTVEHILFEENDCIEIDGFAEDVYVILDGNPMCKCDEPIKLKVLKNCIKVFTDPCRRGYPVGWG